MDWWYAFCDAYGVAWRARWQRRTMACLLNCSRRTCASRPRGIAVENAQEPNVAQIALVCRIDRHFIVHDILRARNRGGETPVLRRDDGQRRPLCRQSGNTNG